MGDAKILLLEGDYLYRSALQSAFNEAGYDVTITETIGEFTGVLDDEIVMCTEPFKFSYDAIIIGQRVTEDIKAGLTINSIVELLELPEIRAITGRTVLLTSNRHVRCPIFLRYKVKDITQLPALLAKRYLQLTNL